MSKFLDLLFGCSHKRRSFPISTKRGQHRSGAAAATGTYVVCLDCGKEFPYDWQQMKIVHGSGSNSKAVVAATEAKPAA